MGYPLTTAYYHINDKGAIVRNKPKFPKGKAEKKAWKRRTHKKGYYLMFRRMRPLVKATVEAMQKSN